MPNIHENMKYKYAKFLKLQLVCVPDHFIIVQYMQYILEKKKHCNIERLHCAKITVVLTANSFNIVS